MKQLLIRCTTIVSEEDEMFDDTLLQMPPLLSVKNRNALTDELN